MSTSKRKGVRVRAAQALGNLLKSPSPSRPPAPAASSVGPSTSSVGPSTPIPAPLEVATQVPLPASPHPASLAPASVVTVPQKSSLSIPSLQIPQALGGAGAAPGKGVIWGRLAGALRRLNDNAALFPPLQSTIDSLLSGFDMFEEHTRNQKECESLALELTTMSETLDRHLQGSNTPPMMDFVVKTVQSIQEQVDIAAKMQNRDQFGNFVNAQQVRDALATCDRLIQVLYRQLQNTQIEGLRPSKLATYDSRLSTDVNRRACTNNTRTGVLSDIHRWLTDPDAPKLCWMNGMAGTGKTTIAYTFAQSLDKTNQLGASFFCVRTTAECRDAAQIVPTIAYQLARFSTPFLSIICRVLKDNPDLLSRNISTQFEQMLKMPLLEVKDLLPELVVVIDALDECSTDSGVELILDILLRETPNIPLKFFVTSRPDSSIRNKIREQPESSRSVYELHSVRQSDVQKDIELYLQEELPSATRPQLKQLAEISGSLFIYAATVVRYIRAGNQKVRLKRMLSIGLASQKGKAGIDELYGNILSAAVNNELLEDEEINQIKLVLWTAVCAWEPMSVGTLATLSGIEDEDNVLVALEPLRSVLYVSEDCSSVGTLHTSFSDYLFDSTRSLAFFCDADKHDGFLARRCFDVMGDYLRFNICRIESSYLPDERIPGLGDRVRKAISPALAYACRYWAYHLGKSPASNDLHQRLEMFLSKQLLFWMEVMNLKHWMGLAVRVMLTANLWVLSKHQSSELGVFVEDAQNFVTSFAANPVSRSTPHIYVSALPFCHQSSAVHRHYRPNTRGLIEPKGTGTEAREETMITVWKLESGVNSVAYSSDSTRLALACKGDGILIRDAYEGTTIGTPLRGHNDDVLSVAFSLDGTRLVSGARDKTIRIWNVQDGTALGPSVQAHAEAVLSVAFSPNATRIASGSVGFNISMWAVRDGALYDTPSHEPITLVWSAAFSPDGRYVLFSSDETGTNHIWNVKEELYADSDPLKYVLAFVGAVVFSPDGTRLVSGSFSNSVRMWNVQDGTALGAPFYGHQGPILSVAFSPDGTHIVSGSFDRSIRIWDVCDGTAVGAPLWGHSSPVWSVAFSSDGTHIVSGSQDHTIRVWNAQNGTVVSGPLQGHSGPVNLVAFSPDGTRIVSCSDDSTVRMWNTRRVASLPPPPSGRTIYAKCVAFSPDGTCIVFSPSDKTICFLNSHDGTDLGTIFQEDITSFDFVAFSPDGERIVTTSIWDRTTRAWSVQDRLPIGIPLHDQGHAALSASFSPNGADVVTTFHGNFVRTRNICDGTSIAEIPLQGHLDFALSSAFSPDGTRVACAYNEIICVWDVQDGPLIGPPFQGHVDRVASVAFSPDRAHIVSGSYNGTIHIWNVQDGTISRSLRGHTNSVDSVAFSSDGKRIVSGSFDRTIRVWNAQDGSTIGAPLEGHALSINSVAFSPDNTYAVSASVDGTIRMWNVRDGVATVFPHDQSHSPEFNALPLDNAHALSLPGDSLISDRNIGAMKSTFDSWKVIEDGWVIGQESQLLFWAPPDLVSCLPTPHNLWVVRSNGSISIDYENLLLGDSWSSCYHVVL